MGLSALLAIIERDGVANFGRACLAFPFMNDIIDFVYDDNSDEDVYNDNNDDDDYDDDDNDDDE